MKNSPRPKSSQPIPPHAKKVFEGVVFDVYQWEQKLYDGTTTTFEKLVQADTVTVFPVLDDGRILLLEQEQPGRDPFISTTGGHVDPGEEILAAAKRELLEESGYEAEEYIPWLILQPLSKIDWVINIFIAKGLKKVSGMQLDGGEKIILKPVTFDEFLEYGTREEFVEKEVARRLLEAKIDPAKMAELRRLFSPSR